MSATLTVRMDPALKAEFAAVTASLGLDPPTVVRMLAVQTVRDRAIPLSLMSPRNPDETTMSWMDEARPDWGTW